MKLFLVLLLCPASLYASQATLHARQLHSKAQNLSKTTPLSMIPGYKTDTPKETEFAEIDRLQEASSTAVSRSKPAQWIKQSAENRPYFRIDPSKDPLFENSQGLIEDSSKVLEQGNYTAASVKGTLFKKCQEGRPPILYKCSQILLEPTIHIEPAKYSNFWCKSGMHSPDDPRCQAKEYYDPARKYQDEVVTVTHEKWTSNCEALEERAKKGLCRLIRKVCPRGPEKRDVVVSLDEKGKPMTRSIQRECWFYQLEYQCDSPQSLNTCEALRKAGCSQIGSRCIDTLKDVCINWEQTFRCPKEAPSQETRHLKPLKLDPSQEGPQCPANKDLGNAITQLEVLNQVQREIQKTNGESLPLHIFNGTRERCTIAFAGFKNCCAGEKGWGVDLKISGCDGEDDQTNKKVAKGKCIEIGTYCAEKVLGVCTRKKRTYCCFPNKLARLLHQQARQFGWGDAEYPECRGFTVEELAQVNFDKINFSEVFEEVLTSMTLPQVNTVTRNLSERLTQMTSTFKNSSKEGNY